jgi:1-acyl-sn-glycerol-3-phosphate acyltransferase
VLIYPEGGVGHTDTISNAKTGAARLALLTKCRVVPIGLRRVDQDTVGTWQKAKEIFTGKIKIRVGRAIDLSQWYGREVTKELLYEVADAIMTEVATLAEKKYIRS